MVVRPTMIPGDRAHNDTWWSGPQNCRSEEGHVRVEGRWQRKQPAVISFSILLFLPPSFLSSQYFSIQIQTDGSGCRLAASTFPFSFYQTCFSWSQFLIRYILSHSHENGGTVEAIFACSLAHSQICLSFQSLLIISFAGDI